MSRHVLGRRARSLVHLRVHVHTSGVISAITRPSSILQTLSNHNSFLQEDR